MDLSFELRAQTKGQALPAKFLTGNTLSWGANPLMDTGSSGLRCLKVLFTFSTDFLMIRKYAESLLLPAARQKPGNVKGGSFRE